MLNHVPLHLKEKVEETLAALDSIQFVEPPKELAGRILAKILEASQPGYYPYLDSKCGRKIDIENKIPVYPHRFYIEPSQDFNTCFISWN